MNTSEDPEFKRAMAESLAELNKNATSEPEEEKKEEEPNPPLLRVPTIEDPEFLRAMQESINQV